MQLTRNMGSNEVKTYFSKVFELKQSGKEFPVNLDEVWPLVYARRDVAIKALKSDFVKGVDFQLLHQNVEQVQHGGHNRVDYILTTECLEYFVVKKVKPIFEIYRTVFHKTINQLTSSTNSQEIVFTNYCKSCRAIGMSTESGAYWKRPQRYPNEFKHDKEGRLLISSTLYNHLKRNADVTAERRVIQARNPQSVSQQPNQQLSLFDDNEKISLLRLATQIQDTDHRMSIVNKLIGGNGK